MPAELDHLLTLARVAGADGREQTYIGGWFGELAAARPSSGFGASPISYAEIRAWAELTGRRPLPLEVALLRRLDACFLAALSVKKSDG